MKTNLTNMLNGKERKKRKNTYGMVKEGYLQGEKKSKKGKQRNKCKKIQ